MKENRFHNLLFPDPEPGKDKVAVIKIQDIEPNPYQPRRNFPDDTIAELMQSIKTYGLLQPIIVRRAGALSNGSRERRLVACKARFEYDNGHHQGFIRQRHGCNCPHRKFAKRKFKLY